MRVPLSWLRELVPVEEAPEELAQRLTFSGTEVTGLQTLPYPFRDVVVAEVRAVEPHPRAGRLSVCRVWDGHRERTVVCGAPNVRPGLRVALAREGATLADGRTVDLVTIRGIRSEGMLCADDELGLSNDHSGLLELPSEVEPGRRLEEVLGPPEVILEVEVTWNRSDCLSLLGVAREVAALYRTEIRWPSAAVPESPTPVEQMASVRIEDVEGCPRYTGRVLTGVHWGSSPFWMRRRLALCGMRVIGNVVDVTNYVMLECGHPLHAFDYDRLAGATILVRRAQLGEQLRTLDGQERPITPEMLVIADADRPVALAGIMGGAESEISPQTRTVFLESATFDPARIHQAARQLGLSTESSYRFERGVDPEGVEWASRRASMLLVETAGASVCRGVLDKYPGRRPPRTISCRYHRVRDLLGLPIARETVTTMFRALGFTVMDETEESCTVRVPSVRGDLEIEADLIEEVARLHGLEGVPEPPPVARWVGAGDRQDRARRRCRRILEGLGLTEVMNYSFLSRAELERFHPQEARRWVQLPNPVSADYAVLRPSLLPQMIATLGRNLARQRTEAACYECGRIFVRTEQGGIWEEEHVAIGLLGPVGRRGGWGKQPVTEEEMFLWVKGIVEALAEALGVTPIPVSPLSHPALEEGWCATILRRDTVIGQMGLVHGRLRQAWRMAEPVGVAELRLDPLLESGRRGAALPPISPFPAVFRDVSLVVPESVPHEAVVRVIQQHAPAELTDIRLFDIYRGEVIGAGRKSLAYSLTYRSAERSLTDEEANRLHETIKAALRSELGAEIREK